MVDPTASEHIDIAPEVGAALADGRPVVALESTIITHGMPKPKNIQTALAVEQAVRERGATPATIAVIGGRIKVGLSEMEINDLGEHGQSVIKTSRRDLPFVVANGEDGATTVAATMIIAALAGIVVFATGGIGGVHRGVEDTLDISADLDELAATSVAVVCAGIKSVLDIGRTLEYLETKGVPVVGYQTNEVPAFYSTSSGFPVDYRLDSPEAVAAVIQTKAALGLNGGLVIANPIPETYSLAADEIEAVIESALNAMHAEGITGKDTTPYLLAQIAERTEGRSLDANIQLVLNNAKVAADIAAALALRVA